MEIMIADVVDNVGGDRIEVTGFMGPGVDHLNRHLRWGPDFPAEVVRRAQRGGLVVRHNGHLELTDAGRDALV